MTRPNRRRGPTGAVGVSAHLQTAGASAESADGRVRLWAGIGALPSEGYACLQATNGARSIRLLCFPYAGGGRSAFAAWNPSKRIASDSGSVEICPLQYPGRETRWGEPGFETLADLVEAIRNDLAPIWTQPFAFFGHSFGAIVAFEVARALERAHAPLPLRLFVSGARAARLPKREPIHDLDDQAFLSKLRAFNGVPEEALRYPDLMSAAMPALRHDFRLLETHIATSSAPISVPISAFGGLQDAAVPVADVLAWASETTKAFRTRFFQGDHFFAFSSGSRITDLIGEDLSASANLVPRTALGSMST